MNNHENLNSYGNMKSRDTNGQMLEFSGKALKQHCQNTPMDNYKQS